MIDDDLVLERELGDDVTPIRVGTWVWYRRGDGQLRERVIPDVHFGVVGDGELEAMLRGERRDP